MTPSTTNTAALPLVQTTAPERIYLAVSDEEYDRDRRFLEHDEIGWSTDEPLAVCVPYVRADLATLTQQQGGEQEATCAGCNGRGEVGGWAGDGYQTDPCPFCTPSGLPDALTGDFDCPKAAECRACPCGFCTALRTKQPAASEGDGRVPEAELLALVSGPYMYHHKMNELQEREAKGFDRCRELTMENIRIWCATRRAMFADNTSKQAAGEAVVLERWGFPSGISSPAERCADGYWTPWHIAQSLLTTPPRHPADEGMAVTDEVVARACVAYDTAAVGEGFMSSLDGDEHTRWMTAALTAALQAGTP